MSPRRTRGFTEPLSLPCNYLRPSVVPLLPQNAPGCLALIISRSSLDDLEDADRLTLDTPPPDAAVPPRQLPAGRGSHTGRGTILIREPIVPAMASRASPVVTTALDDHGHGWRR